MSMPKKPIMKKGICSNTLKSLLPSLLFLSFFLFIYRPANLFPEYYSITASIYLETSETGFTALSCGGKSAGSDNQARASLYGTGHYMLQIKPGSRIDKIYFLPLNHRGQVTIKKLEISWFGHLESVTGRKLFARLNPGPGIQLSNLGDGVSIECLDDNAFITIAKPAALPNHSPFTSPVVVATYAFLLTIIISVLVFYWKQCAPLIVAGPDTPSDPCDLLKYRRNDVRKGAVFLFLAVNLLFFKVIYCNFSMVSAPMYNFDQEPLKNVVDGRGYNLDPLAGSSIEGTGLRFTSQALFKEHTLPLWNPYEGAGQPYAADGEVAALSILQLPLHLAPSVKNWNLFVVLRSYLGAFFALLWLISLGVTLPAALIGSTAFAFTGMFIFFANLVHLNGAIFVPLIFLGVEAIRSRITWKRFLFLSVSTALCINGGNPQPFIACAFFLFFVILAETRHYSFKKPIVIALAFLAGFMLAAPTLFPLIELLRHSGSRGVNGNTLVQFKGWTPLALLDFNFVTTRVPSGFCHFWIGSLAGILALPGLFFSQKRLIPYTIGAAIYLLIGVNVPWASNILGQVINNTPVLSSLFFAKYISPFILVLCSLAALFADRFYRGRFRFLFLLLPLLSLCELSFLYPKWPNNYYDFSKNPLPSTDFLKGHASPLYRFSGSDLFMTPYVSSLYKLADLRTVTPMPLGSYKRFSYSWAYGSAYHYILTGNGNLDMNNKCLNFLGTRHFITTRTLENKTCTEHLSMTNWFSQLSNLKFKKLNASPDFTNLEGEIEADWFINIKGKLVIEVYSTRGCTFIFNDKKYMFQEPGKKEIDLSRFFGQTVHVKLCCPTPTSLQIREEVQAPPVPNSWEPAFQNGIFTVFENKMARPIARFANRVRFGTPPGQGSETLCGETIYIEAAKKRGNIASNQNESGHVIDFSYNDCNSATILLKARQPGWLFIAINNDGNWNAWIDDRKTELFKAQGTFMALYIDSAGSHRIKLRYQPASFFAGVIAACLTLLMFACTTIYLHQKRSKSPME